MDRLILAKRTAGAPLTEAEHQQRIDAARARWSGVATAAGAVAGAAALRTGLRAVQGKLKERAVADAAPLRTGFAQFEAAQSTAAQKEASRLKELRGAGWTRAKVRTLRASAANAQIDLSTHMRQNAEPFWLDGADKPVFASTDAPGERSLRERVAAIRARADDIRANARPPAKSDVKLHIAAPKVGQFERTRSRQALVWPAIWGEAVEEYSGGRALDDEDAAAKALKANRKKPKATPPSMRAFGLHVPKGQMATPEQLSAYEGKLTEWKAAQRATRDTAKATAAARHKLGTRVQVAAHITANPDLFKPHGIKNVADLERVLRGATAAGRRSLAEEFGIPVPRVERVRMAPETVRNTTKIVGGHKRTTDPGYPDPATRRKLSAEARSYIQERAKAWRADAQAKVDQRFVNASSPVRWLMASRSRGARIGALAAGALLGGGLGYAFGKHAGFTYPALALTKSAPSLSKPVSELSKAAPDDLVGVAAELFEAGTAVEESVADRVARVFRDWKTITLEEMGVRRDQLRAIFASDLATAFLPLDRAARGGAGAPVPVTSRDAFGNPRTVAFTFDARSPFVTQAIENHRLLLAGQMADEQLQTIRGILLQQAVSGASPESTARMLRQTIGLAPSQAAHVVSFRQGLEELDPRVMTRALRDRRFDPTIQNALNTGEMIPPEKVDSMVDAYHRRYLALRAMTIARTEGLRAANTGHVAAIEEALKDEPNMTVVKTWIATDDERTRPDHQGLDGQRVVGLGTPFRTQSGDFIRWPHDDQAPARQTVRCRCTLATQIVDRGTVARFGPEIVADTPEMETA